MKAARTVLNNAVKANPGDTGKDVRMAARKVYKDAIKDARTDLRQAKKICVLPTTSSTATQ